MRLEKLQKNICAKEGGVDMITIYTTPSCSSCRKAKKWLEDHRLPYTEKNLLSNSITYEDIYKMLKNAENGFDDIISTRSKVYQDENLNPDEMTVKELMNFILDNPSVLKRPIIVDDTRMQVGYNDEEIRIFVPKRLREYVMCKNLPLDGGPCDYQTQLKRYFEEIRLELQAEKNKQ
jgi:regulatory protein spx